MYKQQKDYVVSRYVSCLDFMTDVRYNNLQHTKFTSRQTWFNLSKNKSIHI